MTSAKDPANREHQLRQARIDKAQKLVDKAIEMNAQMFDMLREAQRILAGQRSLGEKMRAASDVFLQVWATRYAGKYQWGGEKDSAILKRIVKGGIAEDDLARRMGEYLLDDDPFFGKARHPFALFAASINKFAKDSLALEDEEAVPVITCKHEPRCK